MNDEELFHYKMSIKEKNEWDKLKTDIVLTLKAVEKSIYEDTDIEGYVDYSLSIRSRNNGVNKDGFFCVGNYDRAILSVEFEGSTYEEAKEFYIREIVREICHDYNGINSKRIESDKKKDWRYYEVEDSRDLHRIYTHREENADYYVYDTTYDYRKYWFEDELRILYLVLPIESFKKAVIDKKKHMRVSGVSWEFDYEKKVFYID